MDECIRHTLINNDDEKITNYNEITNNNEITNYNDNYLSQYNIIMLKAILATGKKIIFITH